MQYEKTISWSRTRTYGFFALLGLVYVELFIGLKISQPMLYLWMTYWYPKHGS